MRKNKADHVQFKLSAKLGKYPLFEVSGMMRALKSDQ